MGEIAEKAAAERIMSHVLNDAAAIGVGVRLNQFLPVASGNRLRSESELNVADSIDPGSFPPELQHNRDRKPLLRIPAIV